METSKKKTLASVGLLLIGAVMAVCGLLCIFNPGESLVTVTNVIGWVLILTGVGTIAFVLTVGQILLFLGGVIGTSLMDILFGILFLKFDGELSTVFVILYGILLMLVGLAACIVSPIVKRVGSGNAWKGVLIFGALVFVFGIVAIANPMDLGVTIFMIPVGILFLLVATAYIAIAVKMLKSGKQVEGVSPDDGKYFKDVED